MTRTPELSQWDQRMQGEGRLSEKLAGKLIRAGGPHWQGMGVVEEVSGTVIM